MKGILAAALISIALMTSVHREVSLDKASDFLGKLPGEKAKNLVQPFDEERTAWHFVPGRRPGLRLADLTKAERENLFDLLRASLSEAGFQKVEGIRSLEPILARLEGGSGRDLEHYYVTYFGRPAERGAWSWRWEGHHISLNFTYRDGAIIATTPQFLGSNPAHVPDGPQRGFRALAKEEELGRELVKSLTAEQRKIAILAERAPADILTFNHRKAAILGNDGLPYNAMTEEQRRIVQDLLKLYAEVQRPDQSKARLDKIGNAGLDKLKFAWMGGLEPGQGHYYRIQGPTFVIEYDNTSNGANHIHTVWRDFEGDFGRDVLAEHYQNGHKH